MKKTKQILSVFLSVCMIISCMVGMSVTASATSLTMNDLVTAVGTSTFNWSGYKVQVVEGKLMYVTPWNSEEARDLTYNSSDGKYHLKFGIFDNDWYIVIDSDNYITSFMGDNGGTYESYSGKSQYALNLSAPTTPATTTGGFVKVTDKSQITEDNIGESTAAEAKAWIIANLTTLQSEQGTWYDFFFKENGTVKLVILNYTRLDEAHVNDENVYAPEDFSIASYYFSSNENVYFWGGSSTPATTYSITMPNGGTAYVDGEPATTAEAGTVVTIKAKSSVSTPAKFNGWTTTTEGVEFADADSVETTFVMPISDVTITASFEGVTPYIPSYSPSNTSTTTTTTANAPAETMTFEGEETISHTNLLSWSGVSGASSYLISVKTDGKFVPLATTTKTNIDVVHAYNGKYYVSEGGRYTAYTYKDGKFVKGGTITAAQADKLVKANNVTDTYMLQYTKNGKLSSDKTALTVSIKVYYKPAVKASSKDGKVVLKWKKVVGAEKYRIYKYTNNKLTKIADTTANAVRINKVTAGKTYKYAVKAYVDGKWTKVTSKDIVSVKVK